MENTYWHKQSPDKPLFESLLWSRPETKQTAGKLLIIGGNIHGFAAVGQAFAAAQQAGIGTVRIILPDVLLKTVSKMLPEAVFAPSTPSGSFSQQALAIVLEHSAWADGILIAGDLARNSETAILLEKFAAKQTGQITITKDGVDYFTDRHHSILQRENTTLVLTMAQLQRLASSAKFDQAFTFDMNLAPLVEALHNFTKRYSLNVVVKYLDNLFVAVNGQVSTTKTDLGDEEAWRVPTASSAAVWWLQNPNKPFEALTTSLL